MEPQVKFDDNGDAWISEDGGKTWRKADMGNQGCSCYNEETTTEGEVKNK